MTQPVETPCRKCGVALPAAAQHCPRCGTPSLPPVDAGSTLMGAPMPVTFADPSATKSERPEPTPAPAGRSREERSEARTTPGVPLAQPAAAHDAPTQPALRDADEAERFPPGALLLRQYRAVRRLGEGGMGSVYLARDDLSGQEVAVKVLPAALSREPDIRERFVQEARSLAALDHPAIVPLVTFAREGDDHFLVMKYVAGQSIEALIDERGALDIELARRVFRTVVEALGYAHERGVIHRDIKPANVLLSDEGKIFLVDFGISKRENDTRLTQTGMLMGTPQYMSPEQISGHTVDGRSDLYGAGLLLFEMLTGRPPFTGDKTFVILRQHVEAAVPDPRQIRNGEIPRDLLVIIDALLKKDPNERPRHAQATLELLERSSASTPAFGESLTFFDEPPGQRSTPLTTTVPELGDGLEDELDDLALELRSKRRLRAALASLLFGAVVLFAAFQLVPGWAGSLELEGEPPPPLPRIDPHDEAFTLLLRQAQEHLNNDNTRRAWAVLDAALAERPDDKTALLMKARALVEAKREKPARATLERLWGRDDLTDEDRALLENYEQHLERARGSDARPAAKRKRKRPPEKPKQAPKAAAKEALPSADASSPLSDGQLRLAAGQTRREARACYETHVLKQRPDAAGVVVLDVEIQPNGEVSAVDTAEHSFGDAPELVKCLEGLARGWSFPPFSGAPLQFRYTYDLRPTL